MLSCQSVLRARCVPTRRHRGAVSALFGILALLAGLLGMLADAAAVTVRVPGSSDPWLAGAPDGTVDDFDVAPDQSPVFVAGLDLRGLSTLTFGATGAVANCSAHSSSVICCPVCGRAFPGPDGATPGVDGAEWFRRLPFNGLSDIVVPINSLIGVFLGPNVPDPRHTPVALDFSRLGLDFRSLSPQLQQTFFIGDGLTGRRSGVRQAFIVPEGATRLFLGTMDGAQWVGNAGAFQVTANPVPEPSSLVLMALGVLGMSSWRRFGHRQR